MDTEEIHHPGRFFPVPLFLMDPHLLFVIKETSYYASLTPSDWHVDQKDGREEEATLRNCEDAIDI